jgi:predicted GH43/DUF377 family glycosyl hydrolase
MLIALLLTQGTNAESSMSNQLHAHPSRGLLREAPSGDGYVVGPFVRPAVDNRVIKPRSDSSFDCPMRNQSVKWEANHTFNPAAVVHDNKVHLLYRAEDCSGQGIGGHTSRIGLAVSRDGVNFARRDEPVLYPDRRMKQWEWHGGVEDPRIVERPDGTYVMLYTGWNRDNPAGRQQRPRLMVATSSNLIDWTKHGPAFPERTRDQSDTTDPPQPAVNGQRTAGWSIPGSKAGAIVTRRDGERLVATKVNGQYVMYWFASPNTRIAVSDDLINWEIVDSLGPTQRKAVLTPRPNHFDSGLVEPGPPAVMTQHGILLLYNAMNAPRGSDVEPSTKFKPELYTVGFALLAPDDPSRVIYRSKRPIFQPKRDYEKQGQYTAGTTFVQALVPYDGQWLLYYGTADSYVGVAVFGTQGQFSREDNSLLELITSQDAQLFAP